MFKKFFKWCKETFSKVNWKKVFRISTIVVATAGTALSIFFGIKYKRTKFDLDIYKEAVNVADTMLKDYRNRNTVLESDNMKLTKIVQQMFHDYYHRYDW